MNSRNGNSINNYQGYLDPAPLGINAKYGWEFKGGCGDGVINFIDIEQGWILDHNSLAINTLPSTGINSIHSREHGAAVLGIVMMNDKENGGIGITPKVKGQVISTWRPNGKLDIPDAIFTSGRHLEFGDILLLAIQRYQSLEVRKGLPIEIHDGVFEAISLATSLGITVIEPAGNGDFSLQAGVDLDSFELDGKTIFNCAAKEFRDSGAIIVGAATASVPHKRIPYSNYGSRVDCFAWGEKVVTAGSFPRSSGSSLESVTDRFCGTSSAAAIIAGAAIAVQSICEANLGFRLSPNQLRNILSSTLYTTPSANGLKIDRIGGMPDLKKIIDEALKCGKPERISGVRN